MPAIPPSLPPSSMGATGPQPADQGATDLINYIQGLQNSGDSGTAHFGTVVYQYIESQQGPATGVTVATWIQHCIDWMRDVINPGTPSNQRVDVYMAFAEKGWLTDPNSNFLWNISFGVQNIEVNDKIEYGCNIMNMSSSDQTYINLLNWKNSGASASMQALITNLLNQMFTNADMGSWEQGGFSIMDYASSLLSDPNFFTTYANPPITMSDINTFVADLPQISYSSPEAYTLPDYFPAYLALGYSIASESGPLQKLSQALLAQMASGIGQWVQQNPWSDPVWTMGSNAQLQTWLLGTISNPTFLSTYSGITAAEIATVAGDVGLSLPASFTTFYNAMMALLPSDPTSANYKMIMDFQGKWIGALFANPTTWNATTWFEATFASPGTAGPPYPAGMDDLYMLYPLADISTIQSMIDVFVPGGDKTYTQTAWDTTYRTIFAAHGSDTSGVYFDFFKECRTVGSSDTSQAIETWIDNFALGGFSQYPTMKPEDVMNFLANFNLVTTIGGSQVSYVCDFITNYVQTVWLPGKTGSDKQFGQQLINQLVGWVGTEAPPGKLSDLQAFITAQNYTAKYPSSAADITALLASFGLTP